MKKKVLSILISTAVATSQVSVISAAVNGENSVESATKNINENTLLTASDSAQKATLSSIENSIGGTTGSAVTTTGSAVSIGNVAEQVEWKSTRFGTTTSLQNNTISVDSANKTVTLTAGSKDGKATGGKVTGAQDGMSYYYTVIDPSQNFELSADVKVNFFEKAKPDNQAGFGIMARDTIGTENDSSISPSNMCLVGGYNGLVQSVFRNGVTKDYSEPIVMEGCHKFGNRPANDGTATYKLKLKKTNTGYIASVNDGEEVTYYRPKQLEVLDSNKIYLGFFAARVASITVSNIDLRVSNVATDPEGVKEPPIIITPAISVTSSATSGTSNYDLTLKSNIDGNINVKLGQSILYDGEIKNSTSLKIPSVLGNGDNIFDIKYTPSQAGAAVIDKTQTVNMKTYGVENGEVYVSPNGTETGKGTEDSPLDIYSAIKYTNAGQTIKVKGGVYNLTSPIVIDNTNSGTKDKMKTLTAYDGERPIFDFGKKSGGLTIYANYWRIYGIDVTNTLDKQHGITISGSNNLVENVKTYKNGDSGLQISGDINDKIANWPNNNLILNCESYDNMDAAMNNADGFAAKISCGYGNVFRGCVSHNNCDDGWDLYSKLENGKIGAVTIENCIAYGNGTLTDGTVTKGDGNGFKLGGEGISIKHTLKNSLSFNNNAVGITGNSNPAAVVENSTSVDNKHANYGLDYYTGAVLDYDLKNDISFRTVAGEQDNIPDMVLSDNNYFCDGAKSINKDGTEITKDYFKSVEMPKTIDRDATGKIMWPNYMVPVNEVVINNNSSSGHHHNHVTDDYGTAVNSKTDIAKTTETDSNVGQSSGALANKEIEKQVISKLSSILGEGTQVGTSKEVQTSDGNKLSVTALVNNGKNTGLVIAVEKFSPLETIKLDTAVGEVAEVYKFVPQLNKYVKVTDKVTIDKVNNTMTLPTDANATYIVVKDKIAAADVVSEGWSKVESSWYMLDKTGNLLTGWQKDNTNWAYLSPVDGKMQTGWKKDSGKWYFLKENGYMATGWLKNENKWYYLNLDGSMAANTSVDGYNLGSDGALI
ncbi:right-handed parallel beta-helix repeat-containing protein [Clostridium saccharoperbutylacetonicum]|uniref:right-handed parallel beta-helix repeat-containing protein n=1 Tax=Clostridium saccharoperbutylacetonicum TaxID=36745 RepID=UPI0039ED43FD